MSFVTSGSSGESRNTVPNMIGAKIARRLRVALEARRASLCAALRRRAVGLDLVALVVDPHVVVALPLRALPTLLLRRHRDDDYADALQATLPPAITV